MLFRSDTFAGMAGNSAMATSVAAGTGVGVCSCAGADVLVGLGVAVGREVSVGPAAVQVQPASTVEMASMMYRERYFVVIFEPIFTV